MKNYIASQSPTERVIKKNCRNLKLQIYVIDLQLLSQEKYTPHILSYKIKLRCKSIKMNEKKQVEIQVYRF